MGEAQLNSERRELPTHRNAYDDPLVVIATLTSSTTRPRSGYRGSDLDGMGRATSMATSSLQTADGAPPYETAE
jgi:hypothetical protein